MSTIGLFPSEKIRKTHGRRVSEETIYSMHSNKLTNGIGQFSHIRNSSRNNEQLKPLAVSTPGSSSYVAQRVLSAKVLRVKELQNELQLVKNQLHEVMNENKILKNLQKRQDTVLSRYEDTSAALPRLLENHRAEVNTLKAHAKEVRAAARSLHRKLQRSEAELFNTREQYNKLKQIAEDKDLAARSQLRKRIEELEDQLKAMHEKNVNLNRKLDIEQKSHSQQLAAEVLKRKNVHKELQTALREIARLTEIVQKSSFVLKGGDGDNEMSITGLNSSYQNIPSTSRTIKSSFKTPVQQKSNTIKRNTSEFNIGSTKSDSHIKSNIPLRRENETKKKSNYTNNVHKELEEVEVDIPLKIKVSAESLVSLESPLSTKSKSIEVVDNETKKEQQCEEEFDKYIESKQDSEMEKKEKSTNNIYDWYNEEFSEQITNLPVKSDTSRNSIENNEDKFSDEIEFNKSIPAMTNSIQESAKYYSSDEYNFERINSAHEEELHDDLEQLPSSLNYIEKDEVSNKQIDECPYRKANPKRHSKTTKNNLIKIQDHLNQFDSDMNKYLEEKLQRNKNSEFSDDVEKESIEKRRNFKNFIQELEETDRLNENLTASCKQRDKQHIIEYPLTKNINEDNIKEFLDIDPENFLQEIDNSYKEIRSRLDEDNKKMNTKLEQYCRDVASDVQKANEAIDRQKHHLEINKNETMRIKQAVNINKQINDQLKQNNTRIDPLKKNKLLAALKAIDSGQDVDDLKKTTDIKDDIMTAGSNLNQQSMNKKQLMKELFE